MSEADSGYGARVDLPEYGTATLYPLHIECGCQFKTDEKHRASDGSNCENAGRFVAIMDGAIIGRCGIHVSDYWLNVLTGEAECNGTIIDLQEAECDARTATTASNGLTNPSGREPNSPSCTYTPAIRVVQPDQDGFPPKNFCGRHAREDWRNRVQSWRNTDE
jgi:hypothetical protein